MESVSKPPCRAVQLCSGNLKQLRKLAGAGGSPSASLVRPPEDFSVGRCGMCMISNNTQIIPSHICFYVCVCVCVSRGSGGYSSVLVAFHSTLR